MTAPVIVRPVEPADHAAWRPLWDGYNAFYGRAGETALPEHITLGTWERFFDAAEPVHALVAVEGAALVGLAHFLFHRCTTSREDLCYLNDLYTVPSHRGRRIGRQLIGAVYEAARKRGCRQVYWQTHVTNAAGRALYDQVARHDGFIVYEHDLR